MPPKGLPQAPGGEPAVSAVGRPEGWSMESNALPTLIPEGGELFGQPSAPSQPIPGATILSVCQNVLCWW